MKKIINIIFCPQDTADTQVAIEEANKLIKAGEIVTLEATANLIHIDCLALLSSHGFRYSTHANRFVTVKGV